ncbi:MULTISPECIES: hypothetical protein [Halorussus]|uniref:hypothetical protein n=1 Tax=Halorussus TaxID=1070314 RepID=UPI0020A172B3|nr:hypothetical protein [Halorussus vallis]USZ74035.1 hypothetical protein NGM07_11265 [Halorussus vallis]
MSKIRTEGDYDSAVVTIPADQAEEAGLGSGDAVTIVGIEPGVAVVMSDEQLSVDDQLNIQSSLVDLSNTGDSE